MTIKFENLTVEQSDVVIRIVREMFTFYIKQEIESIMFDFSFITRKQFFNQPFEKTFDFETFENMIEKCLDDYAYYQQYKWDYRDWETDRKSTRLNSSHSAKSRMPSSA